MVASEKAIRETNWAGQISLQLILAANEVTSLEAPAPLYAMAYRLGYLPTVAAEALEYFQDVLPPGENTPWFEYKRMPLPWQIPVGVLYDLLASEGEQPWRLTVHFRSLPSDVLLRWDGEQTLRASFFNSLKEAAYICQGSAGNVMGMASEAQDDMWRAVIQGDVQSYMPINNSLRLLPKARGDRRPSVPLRLYVKQSNAGYMSSLQSATLYTSRPVEVISEAGTARSLGDVLRDLLPTLLESNGPSEGEQQASSSGGEGGPSQQQTAEQQGEDDRGAEEDVKGKVCAALSRTVHGDFVSGPVSIRNHKVFLNDEAAKVLVCGVHADLQTPIAWLHSTLRCADHFLYISIIP